MNKQIEEMAKVVCRNPIIGNDKCCRKCGLNENCLYQDTATALYNAGYRKQSEEGAECPTCHGTGRIGTTDWLTKNISKKQLAEEKAQAIAEHEQHIKTEVVREILDEIIKIINNEFRKCERDEVQIVLKISHAIFELKKKYTEGGDQA